MVEPALDILEQQYDFALAKCRAEGMVDEGLPEAERRRHVRVQFRFDENPEELAAGVTVSNVSAGGISLLCYKPARQGDRVRISVGNNLESEADVVDCRFTNFDHGAMATQYRISCAFLEEAQGKRMLVRLVNRASGETVLITPKDN